MLHDVDLFALLQYSTTLRLHAAAAVNCSRSPSIVPDGSASARNLTRDFDGNRAWRSRVRMRRVGGGEDDIALHVGRIGTAKLWHGGI